MKRQSLRRRLGWRSTDVVVLLDEMEQWFLESLVRPHYAKAGNGRQPVRLLIMYFVQQ
jgi:hypothetical protein